MKHVLFWLGLLLAGRAARGQPVPYGHNPAAGHYAAVRGIRLYYESYGAGPPLLLLHGNGGSLAAFGQNIPYFVAHRYRVIAVDSRAHGRSTDPADSLSFEQMADDFAALLTHLRLDSAYVLGWSDGGISAVLLALRHPEKVKRLVVTGANFAPDSLALTPALWRQQQQQYRQNRPRPTPAERNAWKVFQLDVLQPNVPLGALRAVRAPALVVAGDHDLITLEHTVAIYRHLPRAWLWIVPHSGHATLQEHAEEFNRQADTFFRTPRVPALPH